MPRVTRFLKHRSHSSPLLFTAEGSSATLPQLERSPAALSCAHATDSHLRSQVERAVDGFRDRNSVPLSSILWVKKDSDRFWCCLCSGIRRGMAFPLDVSSERAESGLWPLRSSPAPRFLRGPPASCGGRNTSLESFHRVSVVACNFSKRTGAHRSARARHGLRRRERSTHARASAQVEYRPETGSKCDRPA